MKIKILTIVLSFFLWQSLYAQKDTITYYPNGKIKEKSQVVNGVLNGPTTLYYESGKLMAKGTFKNGQPEGVVEFFDENGLKKSEHDFKDGKEVSFRVFESIDDLFYVFRNGNSYQMGLESKSTGSEVLPPVYDAIYQTGKEYYTIVKDQKYYGLMHKSGKIIMPAIYDEEIKNFTPDKPFPAKKNGKFGYLNAQGNEVVPFIYDWAGDFSDLSFGYAQVGSNDKYGMIDKTGKEIIPIIYDSFGTASEGLISAGMNGKSGFIDRNGKVVIPFIYDRVRGFSDGLAVVALIDTTNGYDTKYGYIDKAGKVVIPITYVSAGDFKDGKAKVQLTRPTLTESEANSEDRAVIIAEKIQELEFYIDKTGKRIN